MAEIVIIGPAFPLRGGIANFNEALCKSLMEAGHSCTIISFSLQYPGFLFPGKTQFAGEDAPPGGLRIRSLISSVNPFTWWKTASEIARLKPDRVLIRYWLPFMAPCLGTIARLLKRKLPATPIVAIADNIIPHEKRPGDQVLTRYFIKACDSFVVMSQSVLTDLKKFDSSKPVSLLHHPVYDIFGESAPGDVSRKQLQLPSGPLVLFFGFIRHYKGLDLLLRAFADKRVRELGVRLLVAGEFYDDRKPYDDLVSELGLQDRVVLHDHYIPKELVRYYFGAADLVAQPYRDATQSGVTQIAYHFGKPMLVTRVGGLPEMVPDGKAGYVTEVQPAAIADALVDYFTNNRAIEMEPFVRAYASRFSWSEFARNIL